MISYYVATGIGGAIGAMARVALSRVLPITFMEIPLPILFINIIGCLIMGLLTEFMALYWSVSESVRYLLISGFLGGFTTFSSFALEFGLLFEKNLQFFLAHLRMNYLFVMEEYYNLGLKSSHEELNLYCC